MERLIGTANYDASIKDPNGMAHLDCRTTQGVFVGTLRCDRNKAHLVEQIEYLVEVGSLNDKQCRVLGLCSVLCPRLEEQAIRTGAHLTGRNGEDCYVIERSTSIAHVEIGMPDAKRYRTLTFKELLERLNGD